MYEFGNIFEHIVLILVRIEFHTLTFIAKIPTHESEYFIKHARLNISSENLINSSLKHPGMRVSCTLCIAFITNAT